MIIIIIYQKSSFDANFEGLASNAELYIFNQDDSQEPGVGLGLFRLCLGLYSICRVESLARRIILARTRTRRIS